MAAPRVFAVLLWSCGIHQASYVELDVNDGRDGMLKAAWGKRVGSQYVSRIFVEDEKHTEFWNERDGWSEAAAMAAKA